MWVPLRTVNQTFLLKYRISDIAYNIFITDLVSIWSIEISKHDIIPIVKELNPLLEAPNEYLQTKVLSLLKLEPSVETNVNFEGTELLLELKNTTMKPKFVVKLKLCKSSPVILYKELTLPSLLLIKNFHDRERELIDIIQSKDAEIEEYRSEGIEIKRSHLVTELFLEKQFKDENTVSDNINEGLINNPTKLFNNSIQKMFKDINEKCVELEKDKVVPVITNEDRSSMNIKSVKLEYDVKSEDSNKRTLTQNVPVVKKKRSGTNLRL